jgi:serine/threonine-protein kinase
VNAAEAPLTPEEEARLEKFSDALLVRDEGRVHISDETVYAYINKSATRGQKKAVEDTLMKSGSFCRELLDLTEYLDQLHGTLKETADRAPDQPRPGWLRRVPRLLLRPRYALAAAAIVVAVVIGALQLLDRISPADRMPSRKFLAVLPIVCLESGSGDQAFCDGLSETLTGKLSELERFHRSFWVVPAGTVTRKNITEPREAGRTFGVTLAVTGNLRRAADGFDLTLDLVDVATAPPRRLASAAIAGPLAGVGVLQAAMVHKVAEMLHLHLAPEAQAALSEGDTDVSQAYERYVEGRGYLLRYENVDNLENAITAFEAAVALDSTFALARAGLGEAYWRLYRARKDTDWVLRAADVCRAALELNDDLAPIHITLGNVLNESGEYEAAISAFQRAMAIDSTAAGLFNGLADSYAGLERFEDSEAAYLAAIRVKPDYWGGYNDLGYLYYRNGRFANAAQQYARVGELTPDNYLAFSNLGAMYYYLERWDEAKSAFARSIEIEPSDRAYLNLASIYYIEADYERSAALFGQAVELNDSNYRSWAGLANSYYWIPGQREQSIPAYRRAIELAEQRLALNPGNARMLATLASYYVMVDEDETALEYTERALQISDDKPFVLYFAGYVYEQLGQRDRAVELIGKAVTLGYPLEEIERDPWLSGLRADDRFEQLQRERE